MIVAIHQPNYLPWLGFFHKLLHADVLVILDNVQFPRGKTYVSRVAIKTPQGAQWLTVPVSAKSELQQIRAVKIVAQQAWNRKHLRTLEANYGRCPYFDSYFPQLSACYQEQPINLADFNVQLITLLAGLLGAKTKLVRASALEGLTEKSEHVRPSEEYNGMPEHVRPSEEYNGMPGYLGTGGGLVPGLLRLLDICQAMGATEYLTGQGAGSQRYMEETAFQKLGITVVCQNFRHPVYSQLWGDFLPNLTVLDLLFNHGPEARKILLGGLSEGREKFAEENEGKSHS